MKRILIIKLGALGDFVQATVAMQAIASAHPLANLTLLTTPPFVSLGGALGIFDTIWPEGRPKGAGAHWQLLRRLRHAGFERVYDLQTSSRSSWYFQAMRPFAPEWSGVAAGCSHPHANPERAGMHTLDRQAEQLRVLGVEVPRHWDGQLAPDLRGLKGAGSEAAARYGLTVPYALLVPGGAPHRPAKRWPPERYGALAAHIYERGILPVVIGGPAEAELVPIILEKCPQARSLVGDTSFLEIVALGQGACAAVGNDTGPMHLLAGSGVASLVLFSDESDPARCAARGRLVETLRVADLQDLDLSSVVSRIEPLTHQDH